MKAPAARKLRTHARSIFDAGLAAADPQAAVMRRLKQIDAARYRRIFVVGAGKAGASMARAAERVLGARITAGLVNVKDGHTLPLRRIELNECSHPEPDERGERGAQRIAELAAGAESGDLVLCLISGGASALLPLPAPPVTLAEKRAVTALLLRAGADIHQMNAVRKHISLIKGGQLARLASPAKVGALLLSDVVGDDLDVIGSGPTAPDSSTFADAIAVIERFRLWRKIPAAVRQRLSAGAAGQVDDTPKAGDPAFRGVRNSIVGSNRLAVEACARRAGELGYRALILSTSITGETREIAAMHAAIARSAVESGQPVRGPACILSGGETTVTIRGDGKGGRNQEFALAAAIGIAGLDNVLIFSAGTDGTDGPTNAAGAMADGGTLGRKPDACAFLDRNDSYTYFAALGDLVITGPTNTNVMDVHIMLIGGQR